MAGLTSRRWRARILILVGALFIAAGSILRALNTRDAAEAGALSGVAFVVCVVAALIVIKGGRP